MAVSNFPRQTTWWLAIPDLSGRFSTHTVTHHRPQSTHTIRYRLVGWIRRLEMFDSMGRWFKMSCLPMLELNVNFQYCYHLQLRLCQKVNPVWICSPKRCYFQNENATPLVGYCNTFTTRVNRMSDFSDRNPGSPFFVSPLCFDLDSFGYAELDILTTPVENWSLW